MKHRAAALQKLAEGLDEIVASHAEKLAKGPVDTKAEHHDEYAVEAEIPGAEEEEGEEEGEEESMPGVKGEVSIEEVAAGGASVTPLPEAGPEEMPPPPPEEDEMEKAKQDIAARLAKKPVAIRRG